jgi:hypothetical protein
MVSLQEGLSRSGRFPDLHATSFFRELACKSSPQLLDGVSLLFIKELHATTHDPDGRQLFVPL